jgi:GT2 family glycosyltransferase
MPFRILHRVLSFAAALPEYAHRLRYRRADLRRVPAREMRSLGRQEEPSFQWIDVPQRSGRVHPTLTCPPESRISYEVVLPERARVVAWCGATVDPRQGADGSKVEFAIEAHTDRGEFTTRRIVEAAAGEFGWSRIRLDVPVAGPARMVLATRSSAPERVQLRAAWRQPRIETPRPFREAHAALRQIVTNGGFRGIWHKALSSHGDRLYALWVRQTAPSRRTLAAQRAWARTKQRRFTLITFVPDPARWRHRPPYASLVAQSYPHWEWIVLLPAADPPSPATVSPDLTGDQRIRIVRVPAGSQSADAWNTALGTATGDFAAVVGPDDTLSPEALFEMASVLDKTADCDLLYSDEDLITEDGNVRYTPRFKPDWSPELLLATNYIGRLAAIRVRSALAVGGFRAAAGAEEWEFFLRLSRSATKIRRVPRCLYHRRSSDVPVAEGLEAVVEAHLAASGVAASVTGSKDGYRATWPVSGTPLVSIVIPNRNAADVLRLCLEGLLDKTSYAFREIVIVDNGSTEPEALELYERLERSGRGCIVPFDRPFNFSAACNTGAAAAKGDLLLFLNNDIEVIDPEWLDELVRWAQLPQIGVVGAKLLYPDRTIQHAGVVFGLGLVGHLFSRAPEGSSGVFGSSECYRNVVAVTGACQMMRRDVFHRLGGFDERFRLSFSDVILCMEAWKAGYRVVYTPYARLIHHESYTRKREDWAEDMEGLAAYLEANAFDEDSFFHPELDPTSPVPAVRPPLGPTPRQVIRDYLRQVLSPLAS